MADFLLILLLVAHNADLFAREAHCLNGFMTLLCHNGVCLCHLAVYSGRRSGWHFERGFRRYRPIQIALRAVELIKQLRQHLFLAFVAQLVEYWVVKRFIRRLP